MITHIVLFKLKDPSTENIHATRDVLANMKGRIPTLNDIEVGVDEVGSERSYHLSLITRHDDWAGYEAYQGHPVHQEVLAHMKQVVESAVAVDSVS